MPLICQYLKNWFKVEVTGTFGCSDGGDKRRRLVAGLLVGTLLVLLALPLGWPAPADAGKSCFSHPPLRPLPRPANRPLAPGPAYFVAPEGDDTAPGTQEQPWRSINKALTRLNPGDTLYLRGGIYFEPVYCAVAGTAAAPITIRAYPGELAVIDSSLPEFQQQPAQAWQLFDPARGEYVSTRTYKNIRDVVGRFADSLVGLQTYWYREDLVAANELWLPDPHQMVQPVYCGPGLYYDRISGRLHCRLAHTRLELPPAWQVSYAPYRGATDPRQLPLIIAPFAACALRVDQAQYVRFQDLVFRGGGYITVELNFAVAVEFDNCIIYAGTYGIWAKNTGPLKMSDCGVYGMIPPWAFRSENSLRLASPVTYAPFVLPDQTAGFLPGIGKKAAPEKPVRNLARLPTHALLVTAGSFEFEVFYYPFNHDWEISHCEFTDGHDGVYLSGRNIYFHHNWIDRIQDDAVYLSSPSPGITDKLYIYQNYISTCTAAFAAHGQGGPGGDIYVFRNIVEMRRPLLFHRPGPDRPTTRIFQGSLPFLRHGRQLLHEERLYFYHNNFLYPLANARSGFAGGTVLSRAGDTPRRVLNNIFVFYGAGGAYPRPFLGPPGVPGDLWLDGNLHWNLEGHQQPPAAWLAPLRTRELAELYRVPYPPGLASRCLAAAPKFQALTAAPMGINDYRLRSDSPARGRGVPLPPDWPDVYPPAPAPDSGALPADTPVFQVGRAGRIVPGQPGEMGW